MRKYAPLEIFGHFGAIFGQFFQFFDSQKCNFHSNSLTNFSWKLIKPRTSTYHDPGAPFQPHIIDIWALWSKNIKNLAILLTDPLPRLHKPLCTVNSGSEMVEVKHVSGKNICWSTLTCTIKSSRIGQICSANWLVAQKDNVGSVIFFLPGSWLSK